MKKLAAWLKKLNVKATWKSLVGLALTLTGIINVVIGSGALPTGVSKLVIAVGTGLIAFERIADAIDYRTDSKYNSAPGVVPGASTPTPPAA